MQRAVVVSIHDITPATRPRIERMLAQLDRVGVPRCSLLVVPNYHRAGRSLGTPGFAPWLQELSGQGHEIVLHGFYHQRPRRAGESARDKMITRVYTADEGEFYDVGYEETARLLREAQAEFAAHDLYPTGFVAPAWLLGHEAELAVVDAGFRYTTTLRALRDFPAGTEFVSQSLVYSVRSEWRCALSLFWNRMLFQRLRRNHLLRLALHPPDIDHPGIWRQILALTRKALRDRESMTYQEWLGQKSASPVPQSELA